MSFREWTELIGGMCGLTLEEWEIVQEEVNQHFSAKCRRISLDEADAQEIARMVAMRMDVYKGGEDDAPQQTKMSL